MWKCILQWNLYNEVLGLTNYFFSTPVMIKFRVISHLFQRLFLINWENRRDCHITMPLSLKTVEVQIKGGHWNKRFRTVQFYWKFKAIWKMSFLTNEPAKKAEINILTAREQGFGTRPGHHGQSYQRLCISRVRHLGFWTNLSLVFLIFLFYLIFRSNLFSITSESSVGRALILSLGSCPDFLPAFFPFGVFLGRSFLASVLPHLFQFVSGSSVLLVFRFFPVSYFMFLYSYHSFAPAPFIYLIYLVSICMFRLAVPEPLFRQGGKVIDL